MTKSFREFAGTVFFCLVLSAIAASLIFDPEGLFDGLFSKAKSPPGRSILVIERSMKDGLRRLQQLHNEYPIEGSEAKLVEDMPSDIRRPFIELLRFYGDNTNCLMAINPNRSVWVAAGKTNQIVIYIPVPLVVQTNSTYTVGKGGKYFGMDSSGRSVWLDSPPSWHPIKLD